MITRTGDVFTTEAVYIGHGVNCQGVMGLGIAKTVREKFPETYKTYAQRCAEDRLQLGDVLIVSEGDKHIVNLATQRFPGPDARYDALFHACLDAANQIQTICKSNGRVPIMAIPQIGCGIGGLEWFKVENLLKSVEILIPGFQFEVWSF